MNIYTQKYKKYSKKCINVKDACYWNILVLEYR